MQGAKIVKLSDHRPKSVPERPDLKWAITPDDPEFAAYAKKLGNQMATRMMAHPAADSSYTGRFGHVDGTYVEVWLYQKPFGKWHLRKRWNDIHTGRMRQKSYQLGYFPTDREKSGYLGFHCALLVKAGCAMLNDRAEPPTPLLVCASGGKTSKRRS